MTTTSPKPSPTFSRMKWHRLVDGGVTTMALNVPGGALVRVDCGRETIGGAVAVAETMVFVLGSCVAKRWQRREATAADPSEICVEISLVPVGLLGFVATEKTYVNCVLTLVPLHEKHEVWVSADDDLPALPEASSPARRSGLELIAEERRRQIAKWGPGHDKDHRSGELAVRAAELAVEATDERLSTSYHERDEWGLVEKHSRDRVRQLAIAGALIAAELDRLAEEAAS